MKIVIYHNADFDGEFCHQIARKFLGEDGVRYIGWNYGDPDWKRNEECWVRYRPEGCDDSDVIWESDTVYILDLSVPGLMDHPNLIWIDHHKTAIEKYPGTIRGYRIDGVAACRLALQWFSGGDEIGLPGKSEYVNRFVSEPWAVRLAGEYDVWDKRDPNAEVFQHGLRGYRLSQDSWDKLLDVYSTRMVTEMLNAGCYIQTAQRLADESMVKHRSFTMQWEGLTWLCLNTARCNSLTFAAGIRPEHDGLMGFYFDGRKWKFSLYGVPGKPEVDLSAIAAKYGGGGHRQACGFEADAPPLCSVKTLLHDVEKYGTRQVLKIAESQNPRDAKDPEGEVGK